MLISLRLSSAPVSVWNLRLAMKTVVDSDSVAVFKSRLKTFLFSPGFLSSLFSVAHCLALQRLWSYDFTDLYKYVQTYSF